MNKYFEFGGGLGDVINQIYRYGKYQYLDTLNENKKARVALICHNPFAEELFKWHPKRPFFTLKQFPYWHVSENEKYRSLYELPASSDFLDKSNSEIILYESEEDKKTLSYFLNQKFIVISASAGEKNRNIPTDILNLISSKLKELGIVLVSVGRDYNRANREEIKVFNSENLINKLSVPGTLKLISLSNGLITCHSSLNLYAWHINKPQLLLYPNEVLDRHFKKTDEWSFGKDFDNTVHTTFDNFNMVKDLSKFINLTKIK